MSQDATAAQAAQMGSFEFAPQQFPHREMQKNYVFVDEHNRHKRLKVMRACEGCRKRKIKCDAATTNTWPCSACIRLKLHCVKPNGYEGSETSGGYDTIVTPTGQFQQVGMALGSDSSFTSPGGYQDADPNSFQQITYESGHGQQNMHYTTVPTPNMLDQTYASANAFPTPPVHHGVRPESSPEAQSIDSYQQQDLADLLGGLKVNELGTAPYLRNKASFRNAEQPAIEEEDDFGSMMLPVTAGPGHKIRIPPELMPDEATALQYFDLYFRHVHTYIPVLDKVTFYHQWHTDRDAISPLILEALFAIGGRLAEEPAMGQQWLALVSRHADSFMDVPRLSTLQALLMILKAREAAPKRGYYYRSWMTIVQCVQMGKDLGLDEHFEDHEEGRQCALIPAECRLRTRIWQAVFVCETMVGTPQGRHDLSVQLDSVDLSIPRPVPGGDESEYHVSRNFTYVARIVLNIRRMISAYTRLRKTKDWGVNPEFQQIEQSVTSFLDELPADLAITFPSDNSPPYIPSAFIGNLHSYYYLHLILYHRPVLSFLDPTTNVSQWKHHMMICYNSAKAICRLQEATFKSFGLVDLQSMLRGFSFTMYAGLSCIVLHLVAIVSPDPDLNTDAREFFQRHMRLLETVMEAWSMPDLQQQVDAIREAFSADVRRPFVLKPSFPYGSPHPSNRSTPPRHLAYQPHAQRTASMDQHLDTQGIHGHQGAQGAQHVSYINHPITPPISVGAMDSRSDSPAVQSLGMMPQDGQHQDMQHSMGLTPGGAPTWNPARIFENWNASFGTPAQAESLPGSQAPPLNLTPTGADPVPVQGVPPTSQPMDSNAQHMAQQYPSATSMPNFITPAMWQESVASVYEGGLKRAWDYDGMGGMKRQ